MHRATGDLINSGITDGVVKIGDTAPKFELKDNDKKVIRLKDFLAKGPVILSSFYIAPLDPVLKDGACGMHAGQAQNSLKFIR